MTEQTDSLLEETERQAEKIRREAEADAESIRRGAIEAAERLLSRLQALEFPLGQLVMSIQDEIEQVSRELQEGSEPESRGPAGEDIPEEDGEPERPSRQPGASAAGVSTAAEPQDGTSRRAPGLFPGSEPQIGRQWTPPPALDSAPAGADPKPTSRRGFRRSKSQEDLFISVEGTCAICQRPLKAGSQENLARSGWKISGDVGLCPGCQADRWQLPDGARLPFRRGGG